MTARSKCSTKVLQMMTVFQGLSMYWSNMNVSWKRKLTATEFSCKADILNIRSLSSEEKVFVIAVDTAHNLVRSPHTLTRTYRLAKKQTKRKENRDGGVHKQTVKELYTMPFLKTTHAENTPSCSCCGNWSYSCNCCPDRTLCPL